MVAVAPESAVADDLTVLCHEAMPHTISPVAGIGKVDIATTVLSWEGGVMADAPNLFLDHFWPPPV